jgi:hypothetical protein
MAPRIASLSGSNLDLPRLFRPNAVTTALCFCVQPITERLNVTFILAAMTSLPSLFVFTTP